MCLHLYENTSCNFYIEFVQFIKFTSVDRKGNDNEIETNLFFDLGPLLSAIPVERCWCHSARMVLGVCGLGCSDSLAAHFVLIVIGHFVS